MARRNPVSGLLTGALIGLIQDGTYSRADRSLMAIAKTVVIWGFGQWGELDVENAARVSCLRGIYLVHSAVYFTWRAEW